MHSRIIIAALVAIAAAPLAAQTVQPSPPAPMAPAEDLVTIALDTDKGRIVLALDRGRAPVTVENFLHYVDSGKLNGEGFYRAMKYGQGGLIQGGITTDARKLRPAIAHESVAATGVKHLAGTISMAALEPGKAQADFFILTTDVPAFDASFAAFGRVVEGMEVVKAILAAPTSPTKGEGVMKGQMLEPVVKIVKAERVKG